MYVCQTSVQVPLFISVRIHAAQTLLVGRLCLVPVSVFLHPLSCSTHLESYTSGSYSTHTFWFVKAAVKGTKDSHGDMDVNTSLLSRRTEAEQCVAFSQSALPY